MPCIDIRRLGKTEPPHHYSSAKRLVRAALQDNRAFVGARIKETPGNYIGVCSGIHIDDIAGLQIIVIQNRLYGIQRGIRRISRIRRRTDGRGVHIPHRGVIVHKEAEPSGISHGENGLRLIEYRRIILAGNAPHPAGGRGVFRAVPHITAKVRGNIAGQKLPSRSAIA